MDKADNAVLVLWRLQKRSALQQQLQKHRLQFKTITYKLMKKSDSLFMFIEEFFWLSEEGGNLWCPYVLDLCETYMFWLNNSDKNPWVQTEYR